MEAVNIIIPDVMAKAVGSSVRNLPRDRRALARRTILKVFTFLSDKDNDSANKMLGLMAGLFDGIKPIYFLSTVSRPVLWGNTAPETTGLIKNFQGVILQPGQGLLTHALERIYKDAVMAVQDTVDTVSQSEVRTVTNSTGREDLELVRGEDGN